MTVLDNDETFAMDEFYFSFFSRTQEAFAKLQACLNEKTTPEKRNVRIVSSESTKFKESVKDTTTNIHAPSPTAEAFDGGSSRQSFDSLRGKSFDSLRGSELMNDAEPMPSGQNSPKQGIFGFSGSRLSLKKLSFGRRSPSPSALSPLRNNTSKPTSRSSIDSAYDRYTGKITPQTLPVTEEPSWTDTGKMLWSRGANVADWITQRSAEVGTQVGTMLTSPTTTLNAGVGKVSQLWSGDSLARNEHARWVNEETAKDMKDQNPEERFQTHFALPPTEKLLGFYYGYVFRTFPFYGKMYVSTRYFCFRSLLPGIKTKAPLTLSC